METSFVDIAIAIADANKLEQWNLHQKPLRVEMLATPFSVPIFRNENIGEISHFVGVNAEIIKVLSAVLNFSVVYQDPEPIHGYALPNGSFTGALGRLLTNKSDLGLSLFFIRDYGTTGIDFTTPIYEDQLCVVVQKAHKISETLLPLLTFDVASWLCLVFCMIGSSLFWIFLRYTNVNRDNVNSNEQLYLMKSYSDYLHIIVDTGILFMSSPLMRLPKMWSERFLVISICLMSIIVIAYFQSILATVFVNPLYYRDIKNLGELEESQLPIKVPFSLSADSLFDKKSSLVNQIEVVKQGDFLTYIADYGNLSIVLRKTSIRFNHSHWFFRNQLHQIPDCPRTYSTAFILPKHSIYLKIINQLLIRLIQGGFIQKWIGDMKFNKTLDNTRLYGSLETRMYVVLRLADMKFSFVILIFGFIISFFVFVGEVCTHKRRR